MTTPAVSSVPSAAPKDGAPVVLVVDDDEAMRALVGTMLREKYQVFAAANGVAALEILAQIPPPDAILLDVMMPGIDGFELAKRIRSDPRLQRVPLLYLTAKTGPMDIVAGINAGARHYMTKPFKMPELLSRVARMVGPRT